jgi:tRNA/tmRNA/rRNA uracil-C5-methylase (TrmA/RlmC/RlmD family)
VIVDVERVGHGGVCVARAPDGRVVFVRHSLPGEQVRLSITEERRTYLRADAVEVLRRSAARVEPPCRFAGPGRCGGCDWQHAALDEQRRLKSTVIAEQLRRLAGVESAVTVEPVPGDRDGLAWRTRLRLAVDPAGRAGLRRSRSHEVEPIDDCLIAVPAAGVPELVSRAWRPETEVGVDVGADGERVVSVGPTDAMVTERAAGRTWRVPAGGFWQVHPGAADALVDAVVGFAAPTAGEHGLDLYSGVGLFAGVLGERGAVVTAIEGDRRAADAARTNLADLADVEVVCARVERWLADRPAGPVDLVVLDPPRRGAGAAVVNAIVDASPRVVVYVACDPAALARDVATFATLGYLLTGVRAFDLFPMTAHVECVAAFAPAERRGSGS